MRPTISWSELRGASVGVWGLGVEGLANVRKLGTLGVTPVLVDDQPPAGGVAGRPVLATADGGLAALAALRRGGEVARDQPVPPRPAAARGGRCPGGRRPWAVAAGSPAGPGGLRHRDQGQEQHHRHRRAPADPARLPVHDRRQHRPAALGPGPGHPRRGHGLGLLGHRDVQLPGHRPALLAAGRRGHLAAPRSPALARRRRRGLLPGQAVRLQPARRRPDRGQRGQRPAPRAAAAARAAGGLGPGRR